MKQNQLKLIELQIDIGVRPLCFTTQKKRTLAPKLALKIQKKIE